MSVMVPCRGCVASAIRLKERHGRSTIPSNCSETVESELLKSAAIAIKNGFGTSEPKPKGSKSMAMALVLQRPGQPILFRL